MKESNINEKDITSLIFLGIDDIAKSKGHKYYTMIYNHETGDAAAVFECFPNAAPVTDCFHISQAFHVAVDKARKHIQKYSVYAGLF